MMKELVHEHDVDIVGLQEKMKRRYFDKFFRTIDPHKKFAWHWLASDGKSRGILCGVSIDRFDVVKVEEGQFSLAATVIEKKRKQNFSPGHSLWPCS